MTDEVVEQVEAVDTPAETVSEPADRRAALAAAFEAKEQASETPEQRAERQRDEQGRFKANEKAPEITQETAAEKQARKYPASWKPDVEPLYRRLEGDPELSKILDEIDRREGDYLKGHEPLKQKAQFADAMERAVSPYMATIQSMGVTPDYAVQVLLSADHKLRYGSPAEKAAAIQSIANDYGIDLGQVPQQAHMAADPVLQEINQIKQRQELWFRQQQQASEVQIAIEIEEFAKDKPHFEAVREDMAALMQAGRAENLQKAYDMAIWARPDIRTALLEQQRKDEEGKRKEEAQRAVAAAKTAAVQVRGAPTTGASNPPVTDRRAQIAAAMDRSRI